jgi:prophage regulatory protein
MEKSMPSLDEGNILIRLPDVIKITGISRSLIYAKLNPKSKSYDTRFPTPVKISKRAIAWRRRQIEIWIAGLRTSS